MHERWLVSVEVEPRSTSRLSSALVILPLFIYVIKIYVRLNASMEIKHKNLLGYNLPVRPPLYKNLLSIKFETGSYFQKSLYKNIMYNWAI